MKNINKTSVLAFLWLCVSSCQHNDDLFRNNKLLSGITVNIGIDIAVTNANGRSVSVNTDDYIIDIFDAQGILFNSYQRYADIPDTIILDPGSYYIKARSGNLLPGAFDSPYYLGYSDTFNLNSEEVQNISILCTLGNCKIGVVYSQNIIDNFNNYYTVISNSDTSIYFTKEENRAAYFSLEPLTITAYLEYIKPDSSIGEKLLYGTIDDPSGQKYYEIHFDAQLANPKASINLNVDESLTTQVLNINDQTGEIPGNEINYGSLLITEIMFNPDSLSDTQGEWFEIFNASADSIDLYHLVIKKAGVIKHTISDHIFLEPSGYLTMVRTDLACEANKKYIYGSGISLGNSGDDISLYNYGLDGSNGNMIADINYGLSGFPNPHGASICLDPSHFQVDQAMFGSNWCTSISSYNTGDKGTPGLTNDSCN